MSKNQRPSRKNIGKARILCRFSKIPAVIFLVMGAVIAVLSLFEEGLRLEAAVYLYVGLACILAGLLLLIPVFTFRVTWERETLVWRSVFGVTRRYALSEIKSYRTNMHYTRFYLASGRSFRVSSDHYEENRMRAFLYCVREAGGKQRAGASDSRLFWGNCSRPYQTLLYFCLFFLGSVLAGLFTAISVGIGEIWIAIFFGVLSLGALVYLVLGVLSFRYPKKFRRTYESIEKDPNLWDRY